MVLMIVETLVYQVFIDGLLVCKTLLQSEASNLIFVFQLVTIDQLTVLLINFTDIYMTKVRYVRNHTFPPI